MERESVLFIGTQFSNLYTAVDTPARGRVGYKNERALLIESLLSVNVFEKKRGKGGARREWGKRGRGREGAKRKSA